MDVRVVREWDLSTADVESASKRRAQFFALLDSCFVGLLQRERDVSRLALPWEAISTAFVGYEGDRPVAHVGIIDLPLVIEGVLTHVGSVHAVCTHADYRRQGRYRKLMQHVLPWCAARYETLVLTTANPEYYEPFGFRAVQEHRFVGVVPPSPQGPQMRKIDWRDDGDIALLRRLLRHRQAVSARLGVVNEVGVFFFNEYSKPMYYAADLDALVLASVCCGTLRLWDVVATQMPSLAAIVGRYPKPIEGIEVYFATDRLQHELSAQPAMIAADDYLMVRGPFAAATAPMMLPRSARA